MKSLDAPWPDTILSVSVSWIGTETEAGGDAREPADIELWVSVSDTSPGKKPGTGLLGARGADAISNDDWEIVGVVVRTDGAREPTAEEMIEAVREGENRTMRGFVNGVKVGTDLVSKNNSRLRRCHVLRMPVSCQILGAISANTIPKPVQTTTRSKRVMLSVTKKSIKRRTAYPTYGSNEYGIFWRK